MAMRTACSTTCWDETPPPAASLLRIKIACSKIWGSGDSTTITRLEIPFTKATPSCALNAVVQTNYDGTAHTNGFTVTPSERVATAIRCGEAAAAPASAAAT